VSTRVRFAPSPTGSLHLGNALTAVVNRRFADEHGGSLILRIDDTDPARTVEGGEAAILEDLNWLEVAWDAGPVRQSERASVYKAASDVAAASGGAIRDHDGSLRLGGVTLLRADGSATYQLAAVADDVDLGVTHIIRGSDHRPNEEPQRRIAAAIGGTLPEVIHHGLLLGPDGRKLSKRHGHASISELREDGIPAAAARRYLDELGLPTHDVHLDRTRIGRLAIDAIAAMPDDELVASAEADVSLARALRGARTLVEAREIARAITDPAPVSLPPEAEPTLGRFVELRSNAGHLDEDGARAIVRELKAVGGDLRALRLALTGAERGPELWTVVAALPAEEAVGRALRATVPG
jgi:tRNA synthetases class I (E and Q), catalytic domain